MEHLMLKVWYKSEKEHFKCSYTSDDTIVARSYSCNVVIITSYITSKSTSTLQLVIVQVYHYLCFDYSTVKQPAAAAAAALVA